MVRSCLLKILGRVVLRSGAPVRAALLLQADREQQERQQEEETVGTRRSVAGRDSLSGENCVRYGRIQEEESAMSWGTELWVCFSSLRYCVSAGCPLVTHRLFVEQWPAERRSPPSFVYGSERLTR